MKRRERGKGERRIRREGSKRNEGKEGTEGWRETEVMKRVGAREGRKSGW